MRELEGKLYIEEGSIEDVIGTLRRGGITFDQAQEQVDYVYATSASVITTPTPGSTVARVRAEGDGRATLTVKVRRTAELDRNEFEVEVGDLDAARNVLDALGLHAIVIISKQRRTAALDADTTITLDNVDGLGIFLEIEILGGEDWSGPGFVDSVGLSWLVDCCCG